MSKDPLCCVWHELLIIWLPAESHGPAGGFGRAVLQGQAAGISGISSGASLAAGVAAATLWSREVRLHPRTEGQARYRGSVMSFYNNKDNHIICIIKQMVSCEEEFKLDVENMRQGLLDDMAMMADLAGIHIPLGPRQSGSGGSQERQALKQNRT